MGGVVKDWGDGGGRVGRGKVVVGTQDLGNGVGRGEVK